MKEEEFINYLKEKICKYKKKCKKAKFEILKTYYLGKLYKYQETLRRVSGEFVKITDAYWHY